MDEILCVHLDDILDKRLSEFEELELTNPHHGEAVKDIVELMKVRIEAAKVELEEIEKDDRRVMDKEKLALDKKAAIWDKLFKGVGICASVGCFFAGLNFESTGSFGSKIVQMVVRNVVGGIGKGK